MSISRLSYPNNSHFKISADKQNFQNTKVYSQSEVQTSYQHKLSIEHLKSNFLGYKKSINVSFGDMRAVTSGFDAIAGRDELKKLVEKRIIEPLLDEKIYNEYKVPVTRGILLFGPTGNGKTSFVHRLVEELRKKLDKPIPFFVFETSKLEGKFVGDFPKRLDSLIEQAKKTVPSVVFIDEAERFLGDRAERTAEWEFKADQTNDMMLKIETAEKEGIIFIAATNHIDKIDPAALRNKRFGEKIFLDLPDLDSRIACIKLKLLERGPGAELAQKTDDITRVAEKLQGCSFADLEQIVEDASFLALQRKKQTGNNEPIQLSDLQIAVFQFNQSKKNYRRE